ncbi:cation-translocating P-type ATPase [Streptococcus macacae]|uniref:Calcium-translocating P-type ATPase, PMCA-type n=1 Tax=Streptococcus macacae NCTC 11558 TaxID=764298 RepID=G5JVM8_9STRE|nr:cation-transporting P-type ATPase [Streptococcus macacae]EHJ52225.1 putative calcium-translocating P-type ATPase, PMCA-type [Streptococcus macacae NCTC 11558]SUN78696.1 cation-transporting ATPase [Streptococcus macacae NCTC 11558]
MSNHLNEETAHLNLAAYSADDVFKVADSSISGLSHDEVRKRQTKDGPNRLKEAEKEPIFLTFIKNFTSLMAVLLWVGGAVAILSHSLELGIAIWFVNIINGIFSFVQEHRASQATEALKKMLPAYARVIRDGKEEKILAEELVAGDLVLIEEGDHISADGRLIFSTDLQVNQSALTGESNPVSKTSQPDLDTSKTDLEFDNMVFAGTTVSSGSAKMIVTEIGMATQFGQIAHLTQNMAEDKSPLQKELDRLTKQISIIAVTVGAGFFMAATFFVHEPIAKSFIFALGMIVAFIPEGLLPTVTLSLAMAVQRMAFDHALVKKLSSVETLGATSVICSDKTGTLTQNEMTVNQLWQLSGKYEVTGLGYSSQGDIIKDGKRVSLVDNEALEHLVRFAHLCSNAQVLAPDEEHTSYTILGDPTEACLNVLAEKAGITLENNHKWGPRLKELPFDSIRKRMTTIHNIEDLVDGSQYISITKGAPKEIAERCHSYKDQTGLHEMTDEKLSQILQVNDDFAQNGLRVLAIAYRPLEKENLQNQEKWNQDVLENDMVFLGLVAMSDPPREGVKEAIEKCHQASIRIIMVTGDYGLTALSIAKKIGIVTGDDAKVISGLELEAMSDADLKEALRHEIVFARVAPEQKYRVVTALQELGEVVAVTGDGVNDAPALKKANIGVAMGITGTDVAKESADMILTDDHFASIVHAVEEGRAVYHNIKKFLTYIFNSNTPEAVPSAFFLFSRGFIPLPLTVMQILAIDLGTDMIPALGLGVEPPEKGVMKRPPRKLTDRLLNRQLLLIAFVWYGLIESVLAMGAFFLTYFMHNGNLASFAASGQLYQEATSMTLGAIVFCQIGMVMNSRAANQSIRNIKILGNSVINLGLIVEFFVFLALIYLPFFQNLFHTASLGIWHWLYLFSCPFIMIALDEIRKYFVNKKKN